MLAVSQRGEFVPWIEFFLLAVRDSAKSSLEIAHRLIELRGKYHQMAQEKKWPATCLVLIDALFERPVLTIKRVEALARVTTPTASAHLKRLEEAGIVSEQTGRPRNRIYLAPELVRAVHTPNPGA